MSTKHKQRRCRHDLLYRDCAPCNGSSYRPPRGSWEVSAPSSEAETEPLQVPEADGGFGHFGGESDDDTTYRQNTSKTSLLDLGKHLRELGGRPDHRLVQMRDDAGGFLVGGRSYVAAPAQHRRDRNWKRVDYALRNRPDIFTPSQREALEMFYGHGTWNRIGDANAGLSIGEAAKELGVTRRAFADRLERADARVLGLLNYNWYANRKKDVPPHLKKYGRKRPRKGRPSSREGSRGDR